LSININKHGFFHVVNDRVYFGTVYYPITELYEITEYCEKRNGVWDTIYSTLSQNNSIKYISKANNLHYKIWEALQELYSTHGLTENQAEVAAKLNFDIPLKHSTLRNTKQQLKKKLGNIEKILQIWDDLEWV